MLMRSTHKKAEIFFFDLIEAAHGNGPHPSIRSSLFGSTDWEEDGERVWDVMRGIDYLLNLPLVDPNRLIVSYYIIKHNTHKTQNTHTAH